MSKDLFVVTVPQLGVNDEMATIVEWHVSDESTVSIGELLCTLETTKATFDVEAETTGHVVHLVDASSEVRISQPIALIGLTLETLKAEKDRYASRVRPESSTQEAAGGPVKATQKAKDLAQRLAVDLAKISAAGIIREQDVLQYHEKTSATHPKAVDLSWDPARQPVAIYGAGRGAMTLKECLDFDELYQVVCFIDDDPQHPSTLCELPVYHSSRLQEIVERGVHSLACEIANGSVRLRILKQCDDLGIDLINVIHPQAYIAPTVRMGKGNYVKAGAVIETNTVIGHCCIIDNGAVIAHDNVLRDGCHIAPGVAMGSSIYVGELTIVGIGASIATSVQVGRSAIISVGSSVVKDVPDYAVVEGVPGRVVGKRKSSE